MQSIISEIYYGNNGSIETLPLNKSVILKERQQKYKELYDIFNLKLTEGMKNELIAIMNSYESIFEEQYRFSYVEGFKIGVQLAVEALYNKE